MPTIQNLIEYYDELFPVTAVQKKYYDGLVGGFAAPVKFLRVECGTGMFESILAREGHDVTGIESVKEMLRSANLRRRNQLMSIRFFQMSYRDMTKFLGKGFYNIISCLDDRVMFLGSRETVRNFFLDCRQLLSPGGVFVLGLLNFDNFATVPMSKLPTRESVRAKLFSEIWTDDDGFKSVTQNVETGSGRMLPVLKDAPVYPLRLDELREFAAEAGFGRISCYSSFAREPFTGREDRLVVEMGV